MELSHSGRPGGFDGVPGGAHRAGSACDVVTALIVGPRSENMKHEPAGAAGVAGVAGVAGLCRGDRGDRTGWAVRARLGGGGGRILYWAFSSPSMT